MIAIRLAAMLHIEDQHYDLVIVGLVQNSPVADPNSPCPRISHQLRGLSWPRILRKPVDNPPHPLLNYTIKPFERLTGLIAEDDLVNH